MNGRVHPPHPHPAEEEDMRGKDVKTSERPTPFTGWGLQVSLSFSLALSRFLCRSLFQDLWTSHGLYWLGLGAPGIQALLGLDSGSVKALFRLYLVSVKALLRRY
jgi:hypothetical protein